MTSASHALLPVVAGHQLARCDPTLALELSDLLEAAVSRGTRSTYRCGFESLQAFCTLRGLSALPVDAVTLASWMMERCKSVKVKSVMKYMCGIRFAHIMQGLEWKLSDNPLIQATITSLKKHHPSTSVMQKVPLSLDLILKLCKGMQGWPVLERLSFNDLLWATASSIAFFAALRGGEFFIQPKSDRPILTGGAVNIRGSLQGYYVLVNVPSPKTRKDLVSVPAMAASPSFTKGTFPLDPVRLLRAYRLRASSLALNVLGHNAAFKSRSGAPIDRKFMVGRAESLRARANIRIFDTDGKAIKVSAASWRAGFVMSARHADVLPSTVRSNGRWTSAGGPIPYMVDTLELFQKLSSQLVTKHYETSQASAGANASAGGKFVSSSLLL
jgi:hypothetical protein